MRGNAGTDWLNNEVKSMTSNMEFILEQSVKALVRVTGVGYEARKIEERAYGQAGLDMYGALGYYNREKEVKNYGQVFRGID